MYYYRLVNEYLRHASAGFRDETIATLSSVNPVKMAHTRDGVSALCYALEHGKPKDRKAMVKAMKGI